MYSEIQKAQQQDELLHQYTPLVKRIAHHMMGRLPPSVQLDDLLQAGMMGLLDASRQYDPTQGASFETYATIRVRGAMIDELRRYDWTPKSVHRKARALSDTIRTIEQREGRDARDEEIAAEMELDVDEYHQLLRDTSSSRIFSLEDMAGDGDIMEVMPADTPTPQDGLEDERFQSGLAEAIRNLPEREAMVMAMYYDRELNLREIGEVIGVTESRVSQILSQAHKRLRARLVDWAPSPA
ncbi:MAG: RNA polymerase sigma factor FliA [Thiohalospira sp.]